jgi:endonuclease/exonuclease/phosphatase family metal-dependent hydrolase
LTSQHPPTTRVRPRTLLTALGAVAAFAALAVPAASDAAPKKKAEPVTVMTRNLFLGADLSPGLGAGNLQELSNAAGQILNQVDDNDFRDRSKILAGEIKKKKPDLVGLQEVAWWRTAPCSLGVFPPKATTTHSDFLKLLLKQLNKGRTDYRVVITQPEFDFEVPVNVDGDESTGTDLGVIKGCETNGRLTMRDVILAKKGGVKTTAPRGGNFDHLLTVAPGGVPNIDVTRGWTRVDAKVDGSPKFRFVNTHLEAFDDETQVPSIRAQQAGELVAPGGPATGRLPVILVGDLNSDVDTEVTPGDAQADPAMLDAGFVERSTSDPLGCCLQADVLSVAGGGDVSQFDHKVDHVMTNAPKRVKLISSSVTGRQPVKGFWGSDHAGLASTLKLK